MMMWGLAVALAAGALGEARLLVLAALFLLNDLFRARAGRPLRMLVVVLAATCWLHGHLYVRAQRSLIERARLELENGGTVRGWISSYPQARMTGTSFVMRGGRGGHRYRLLVYSREFGVGYGDSLTLSLRKPSSRSRGFGPEFLLGRGVDASVRAIPMEWRSAGATGAWLTRRVLWPGHQWLRTSIAAGLGSASAVPLGLVVAERGAFGKKRREYFKRLGIAHLIALSGFHLGLVAGAMLLLARRLRAGRGLALAVALTAYVGVVGEVHSLHRALVMAVLILMASRSHRPVMPTNILGAAALVLGLCRPTVIFSIGFQLSVTATAAVLIWVRGERGPGKCRWWRRVAYAVSSTVRLGTFVQAALVPLLLIHFGEFSMVSPLATLIFVLPVTILLAVSGLVPFVALLVPATTTRLFDGLTVVARLFDALLAMCASAAPPLVSADAPNLMLYYVGFVLFVRTQAGWLVRVVGGIVLCLSFVSFS